jgi:erythromycin esterase-like protein
MNEMQHNWIRERATKLESCRPQAALSPREQQAVDRIVGDAAVIALGDMTHGSKEILRTRERLLRFLIQERHVSTIVIEACFAATRRLNDYLVSGAGTAVESLTSTEYWSCLNRETLEFVDWIHEHNLARHGGRQPVRVYGCDLQSIDGPDHTGHRLSPCDITNEHFTKNTCFSSFLGAIAEQRQGRSTLPSIRPEARCA